MNRFLVAASLAAFMLVSPVAAFAQANDNSSYSDTVPTGKSGTHHASSHKRSGHRSHAHHGHKHSGHTHHKKMSKKSHHATHSASK